MIRLSNPNNLIQKKKKPTFTSNESFPFSHQIVTHLPPWLLQRTKALSPSFGHGAKHRASTDLAIFTPTPLLHLSLTPLIFYVSCFLSQPWCQPDRYPTPAAGYERDRLTSIKDCLFEKKMPILTKKTQSLLGLVFPVHRYPLLRLR